MKNYVIPRTISSERVKTLRHQLKMTQGEFAAFLGCSKPTVERWESGKKEISGPVVTLLEILSRDRDIPKALEIPERSGKLRLYYMYEDMVCTIIDVDEPSQKVWIYNYTRELMFRAFGKNTEPTFEDYEEFIESRCFPRTRDKLKLELERIGVPFYDPILIIEKTEGRMAEDRFWIRIER